MTPFTSVVMLSSEKDHCQKHLWSGRVFPAPPQLKSLIMQLTKARPSAITVGSKIVMDPNDPALALFYASYSVVRPICLECHQKGLVPATRMQLKSQKRKRPQ